MRLRDHEKAELSLYSNGHHRYRVHCSRSAGASCGALQSRTNYDLGRHQEAVRQES